MNIAKLQKIIVDLQHEIGTKPLWIRLPRPREKCPYTGLSRTGLIELVRERKIKSVVVKSNPEATRGTVMINYDALMAYIETCPKYQGCGTLNIEP